LRLRGRRQKKDVTRPWKYVFESSKHPKPFNWSVRTVCYPRRGLKTVILDDVAPPRWDHGLVGERLFPRESVGA
jgi:hypothetical protein